MNTALEKLRVLRSVETGCYDNEELEISRGSLDTAEVLLHLFESRGIIIPVIGPTEDGEIRFQWTKTLTFLTISDTEVVYEIVYNGKVESETFNSGEFEGLVEKLSILNGINVTFYITVCYQLRNEVSPLVFLTALKKAISTNGTQVSDCSAMLQLSSENVLKTVCSIPGASTTTRIEQNSTLLVVRAPESYDYEICRITQDTKSPFI